MALIPVVTEIWGGINTGGYRNLGLVSFRGMYWTVFNFFALSPVVTEFWGVIITGGYRILGWHYHRWLQKFGVASTPVVTEIWGGINTGGYRNLGWH